MTYEEFKKCARNVFPNISCKEVKNFHKTYYPDQYTIANINVCLKEKEEGINPMIIYDAPKMAFKAKAAVANAQIVNAVPVEATQRDYTIERIKSIVNEHDQTLRNQFNMDSKYPKTFLELEALIKAGDYIVSDAVNDENAIMYSIFHGVKFGKPSDKVGYTAAKDALKAAAQKAMDGATLKTIDQLEAVIDGFEAWTLPTTTAAA